MRICFPYLSAALPSVAIKTDKEVTLLEATIGVKIMIGLASFATQLGGISFASTSPSDFSPLDLDRNLICIHRISLRYSLTHSDVHWLEERKMYCYIILAIVL